MSVKLPTAYTQTQYDQAIVLRRDELSKIMMTEKDFKRMSAIEFAFKTTFNPILKGAAIGTATGAITGGVVGSIAGPPGTLVGAGKGAFIGLLVGTLGGVIYMIVSRSEYKIWRTKHSQDDILDIFKSLHEDDEVMRTFICPISQEPMREPYIDRFGNCYEKEEIMNMIKVNANAQGYVTDPKRNGVICIADLQPAVKFMVKMDATYSKILKEDSEKNNIHPEVKEGLKRAAQHFSDKVKNFTEKMTVKYLEEFRAGTLTSVQYAEKIASLLKEISPEI
jgi:hypothetical protein